MAKFLITIITSIMMLIGGISGVNYNDTVESYEARLNTVTIFENTRETARPATDVYGIISNHFNSELPEGKTTKKAIVIGFDGCRADVLSLLDTHEKSAINDTISKGGKAYLSYAGGKNYPEMITQQTSTAAGWCSMLTGKMGSKTGIVSNNVPKSNANLTLLTTMVKDGTIDASAFYTSWGGHFNNATSTYYYEKQYCEKNNLDVTYCYNEDDNGTYSSVIEDISKADCSDFIFSILEFTDHEGHSTGYCPNNEKYVQAFADADSMGSDIISAIEARDTYAAEDWLIVITSDHGGYNTGHGSVTEQERYTFIVVK